MRGGILIQDDGFNREWEQRRGVEGTQVCDCAGREGRVAVGGGGRGVKLCSAVEQNIIFHIWLQREAGGFTVYILIRQSFQGDFKVNRIQ